MSRKISNMPKQQTSKEILKHYPLKEIPKQQILKEIKTAIITQQQKSSNPVLNTVYKRIRNLNKKLLNIEQIENQSPDTLKQGQKDKIQRKQQTINEIKKNQQFVHHYKNIMLETGVQIYDPIELVNKVSILLAFGQYIDKNKGLLFKPQITNDIKNIYENVYKHIVNSNQQNINIQEKSNLISNSLLDFIKNQKQLQICKNFNIYVIEQKKDQQINRKEKQVYKRNQSEQNNKREEQIRKIQKKKYTTKSSWVQNSSDQEEQNQVQEVKVVKANQLIEVNSNIIEVILQQQIKIEISKKSNQQTSKIESQIHVDQWKKNQQILYLEKEQKAQKKRGEYVPRQQKHSARYVNKYENTNYQTVNHNTSKYENKYSNKYETKYQRQYNKYENKYERGENYYVCDKDYQESVNKNIQDRQQKTNKYPSYADYKRPAYGEEDYHKPRDYSNRYPYPNKTHYNKPYYQKKTKYPIELYETKDPKQTYYQKQAHYPKQTNYPKEHRHNERPERRRDSDTSLEETPEKINQNTNKSKQISKYQSYTNQGKQRKNPPIQEKSTIRKYYQKN